MTRITLCMLLLLSAVTRLFGQNESLLELTAGNVFRSSAGQWTPYSSPNVGFNLTPVDTGIGHGYFISAGWASYVHDGSDHVFAFLGVRVRFEQTKYNKMDKWEMNSPSSFVHAYYTYTATRTLQSVGLSAPIMVAFRPTPWGELRLGMVISGIFPIHFLDEGTLVTTTDHYTGPWYTYSHTTTSSVDMHDTKYTPDKAQFMITGTIGYRQRIGRVQFGPDLMYRLIDEAMVISSVNPWMLALGAGWSLR